MGILVVAFPVYLAIMASTFDAATIINGNMPLIPGDQAGENYTARCSTAAQLAREPVGMMMMNSMIMAMGIAFGKILISILSAYAVVYFKFPFRKTAFWIIFITLMLPVEVRIYPTYKIVADLGLLDTYTGLDHAADRLGDRHAAVPPVLHDDSGRAAGGIQDRRRGRVPVLQGHAASALDHDDRGVVRDPVHLWLEPVSLAAADHHQELDADHRHRHQEDDHDAATR